MNNHNNCKHPTCNGGPCRRVKEKKKPKPIKKITSKQIRKNRKDHEVTQEDWAMYLEIWEERPHVDFETGEIIPFPLSYNFHHVLPKKEGPGGYPQFRHEKWNIVLVNWQTHSKAENNIDLCPKIKAYRDYLIKTYIHGKEKAN